MVLVVEEARLKAAREAVRAWLARDGEEEKLRNHVVVPKDKLERARKKALKEKERKRAAPSKGRRSRAATRPTAADARTPDERPYDSDSDDEADGEGDGDGDATEAERLADQKLADELYDKALDLAAVVSAMGSEGDMGDLLALKKKWSERGVLVAPMVPSISSIRPLKP